MIKKDMQGCSLIRQWKNTKFQPPQDNAMHTPKWLNWQDKCCKVPQHVSCHWNTTTHQTTQQIILDGASKNMQMLSHATIDVTNANARVIPWKQNWKQPKCLTNSVSVKKQWHSQRRSVPGNGTARYWFTRRGPFRKMDPKWKNADGKTLAAFFLSYIM